MYYVRGGVCRHDTMLVHNRREMYEAYDDYESEEGDEVEEGEEEEDPRATKELMDFLKLREDLKEKIRHKYKKDNVASFGSNRPLDKKDKASKNVNFGSFFGPSQRVIAPRVIEESKNIRESERASSRSYPSSAPSTRRPLTNSEGKPLTSTKPLASGKTLCTVNEVQKKVQTLREARDYSFLLSDDADLPLPARVSPEAVVSPALLPSKLSSKVPKQQPILERQQPKKVEPSQRPAFLTRPSGPKPSGPKLEPRGALPCSGSSVGGATHSDAIRRPVLVSKKPVLASLVSGLQRREAHEKPKQRTVIPPSKSLNHQKAGMKMERKEERMRERADVRDVKKKGCSKNLFGDDDDDDIDDPISFLRNKLLSKYHSSKYQDDGDDSDMEVNFDDIMKEERRSTKIAKQEDEEQLRLIEEEEERERMRREAKRRKMQRQ